MALLSLSPKGGSGRGRWWIAWAWLAGSVVLVSPLRAAAPAPTASLSAEYQVKAGYLFKFAQFAEWPARAFGDPKAPFVIGVLGEDPFGSYLDDFVNGEKIGQHPLVVRRFREVGEVSGCHILFVSRSEAGRVENIIETLKQQSLLTISDIEGFARLGGMVRFVMENRTVRLRVNYEAAKTRGVTISSKILRWATIVTTGKD
jgi:hypothetical protein